MSDERMQILKMVESGKLSAEEAGKLLEAVEPQAQVKGGEAKHVRIRIQERGKREVNVRLPVGLIGLLLRFVPAEATIRDDAGTVRNLDIRQLEAAVKAGQTGRVVEVEQDNSRVEIFLE